MGNELFTKYTIEKTPFLQTGFLSLWSVHNGIHKEKNERVCIFIIDKKVIKSKFPKKTDRKEIMTILKKDPLTLVKYSHRNILKVIEPLIEDKTKMGFITEPFTNSLGTWCDKSSPSKLEIKQILTQIMEGVEYLNTECLLVHNNLNPSNIFITKENKIKIGNLSLSQSEGNLINYSFMNKDQLHIKHLSYMSPEVIIDKKVLYQSDTFSFGCIIFTMLKRYINDKNKQFLNNPKTISQYKDEISQYESHFLKINFTRDDNNLLHQLLQNHPFERGTIQSLSKNQWFNDSKLKALNYIKNINGDAESLSFLSKLPDNLQLFENKIIEREVLPSLLNILNNNTSHRDLVNAILPCIFTICDMPMIKVRFETKIWPKIKLLFKQSTLPATCLLFLINKMTFLGEKISKNDFETDYLHVICKSIDSGVSKLQIPVIDNINYLVKKISIEKFNSEIYTRLIKVLINCNSNFLKVKILNSVKFLFDILDHNLINDSLLKNLSLIKINEVNVDVCMSMVTVYEEIAKFVSVESIANNIIPVLVNILVIGNISKEIFDKIMSLVLTYLNRIKESREKDLERALSVEMSSLNAKSEQNSEKENSKHRTLDTNFFENFFNETNNKINTELNLLNEMNNEHNSNNNILPNIDEDEFKIKLSNTTIKKSSPVNKEYTMLSLPANNLNNHHADKLFDDNYVSESDDPSIEKDCITQSNNHDNNILTSPIEAKNNNESEPRPELLLDDIE